ncbi:MAG: hypothetical protein HQL06_01480 [Nitrospirae bacterium]|nr:hypothetical protein [Nitrospirota bacterium]
MEIKFSDVYVGKTSLPNTDSSTSRRFSALGIPTSDKLTGLEVRLSNIFIIDNKQAHIWPFIRYSDLYFLVLAIDDVSQELSTFTVKGFADVDDNEQLPVDRTIYYWKDDSGSRAPGQIHTLISVIKSNDGIRDLGNTLTQLKGTDDYRNILATIKSTITGGSTIIIDALTPLASLVGSSLGNVDDTPLITAVYSFTDISGNFDDLGRHPAIIKNRYVELGLTLIVRDKNRQDPVEKVHLR